MIPIIRHRMGSLVLAGVFVGLPFLLVGVPVAGAASGDLAWSRVFNGTGNGPDSYNAAAAAPRGGVYVAGQTFAASVDFLVARYAATGKLDWRRTWDDAVGGDDEIVAEATGPGGALAVAGHVGRIGHLTAAVVAKYSASGKRLWVPLYGAQSDVVSAQQVAVDASGDIYVLGRTVSTTANHILPRSPSTSTFPTC